MTTILKDSLGGNCKTVMVATLSSDIENLEETISTARFAQRCSQLVNEVNIWFNCNSKIISLILAKLIRELEYYKMHFGSDKSKNDRSNSSKLEKNLKDSEEEERKLTQFEYFEINANVIWYKSIQN